MIARRVVFFPSVITLLVHFGIMSARPDHGARVPDERPNGHVNGFRLETQDIGEDPAETIEDELSSALLDNTIASYAIGFLVAVVIVILTLLIAGEFLSATGTDDPQNATFGEELQAVEDNTATAFVIFGVALLIVPAVAAVVLVVRGFGGLSGFNGGNGGR